MTEFVEITTRHGQLGVRYAGSREEQPTELHVAAPMVTLGRFDYSLSFYMELAPGYSDEQRTWRIAVGSVKGRRQGGGRNLSASASDTVHHEIRQLLTEWLQQESEQRTTAMILWLEERAEGCVREADRLEDQAAEVRSHGGSFFERAAVLRTQQR